MDKKTFGGVSKKKGMDGVSSAAYGAVASATGSGGAPTAFKSSNRSRRQAKLKIQERRSTKDVDEAAAAAAAVATLANLTTKVEFKALMEGKGIKEIGQQQQTTGDIALPIPPATVDSIDVDDEEDDLLLSKAILLDTMLDYSSSTGSKKRKKQAKTSSQRAAAEIKEKALKRARKIVVKPPLPPSTVLYSTGLLEDPFLKKIASEEKDMFKDIAANIVSKEKVEKQLLESSKKLQELSSESETFKQKEVELLAKLGELRKSVETSAAANKDLEQTIEMSKAELEQTKLVSLTELQRIQSEAAAEKEEKNQRIREIEARNTTVLSELERERSRATQATEESERRAAEAIANNQEEIESLRRDLEANSIARAEEMSVLQRESESRQTRIRELEEMVQSKTEADMNRRTELMGDIRVKEREIETLRRELLANKSKVDAETASMAEKVSRLEAAEARTKHLERQLAELHLAKEEERRLLENRSRDVLASSERKMKELQAQLEQQKEKEAQFMLSVKGNNEELRERFKREKEILQRELEETSASRIAATQIAEEARKESERIKASIENAKRLVREAEERRAIAEKKEVERTSELQEIQRKAKEESERLNREKRDLIKRIEDAERQQERLEKEKREAMAVERYETAAAAATTLSEIPSYQNIVSEVSDAMGTIQNQVMAKNQMFTEDVTQSINDLKNTISSSGQELAARQDSHLAEGIRRFGDLIKKSMSKGEEIQEAMDEMIRQIDVKTAKNQASISAAVDVVKRLEGRIVEGMDHDDQSDTNKNRLAWNFIKQSLVNMISTAYTEINNLRMAVRKSSVISDKEYVESAKKAAERTFLLLVNDKDLENILVQLGIRVTFFSRSRGITPYGATTIVPDVLEVEVKSVGNDLEDDIKTIKIKMSMASATYREIETILSGVRAIAVQFANTERQSLQEIETSKIITNLEDSTASRLYYELDRFYFFASTIEDVVLFLDVMRQNSPLLKVFNDAISFMGSRRDNRGIMEFLKRKGYTIREDTANSIDDFFSGIMGVHLTEVSERERRKMDESVFLSTVIGILATVSEAIQKITNKIEEDRKKKEIRDNQIESRRYLEEQLQVQRDLITLQRQPTQTSIAAEIEEEEKEGRAIALPSSSTLLPAAAEELRKEIRQITNIVKDSEEKHCQDIDILIDSAVRETKNAYEGSLDRLKKQYEVIQAQQLEQQRQFQEQLQTQKEQQQIEQEYMKRAFQEELEQQTTRKQQHDQMALPPHPPSSSSPSRGPVVGNGKGASGERRDDDCIRRVFNAAMAEFRSDVEQVHDNLKMSVEHLIPTLSTTTTASSRIPATDLSNLKRAADTYIHDMDEQFRTRSINLPIDVLLKIKRQCNNQDMPSGLVTQLSGNISSVIFEMDDKLSRYRAELYGRIAELQDRDMEVTETGPPREDETARLAREMKERLTNALTRATEAAELNNTEEKAAQELLANANGGGRNIKMFLKPEEGSEKNFVEVDLSSKDSGPRNINTEGLKKALPDMPSEVFDKVKKASSSRKKKINAALKKNTLTGKIFLDTLKDKVFPYSSKSALEEGCPAALHHPEYFRSSFNTHFIRDSREPPTFAEKSETVRNFTRLLEYSLFNDTARGARSDNDMLSRLIYVVFEHDAKMIRYLSDITYKFREYASGRRERGGSSISLDGDRGNLLEATIATVFSAALPVVSSMAPRIAEALSKPVHDDVRIRSTYSLLSLIEKFIFCTSKRVHVLENVLEKSGLVTRLSLYPEGANANRVTTFDVQYDYSLLRMLLELMTINITNLVDAGIRPLKAVVLSIGTFTDADKTRETDRTFIPIDGEKSILSTVSDSDIDVPKTISVVNYLSAVTDWYVANRFNDDDADKENLNKAVDVMHTLLTDNLGVTDELAVEFNTRLTNAAPSTIVEYVSKTALPKLNTIIEEIVKKTKSNDAILVKGASEVGSLGETAVKMSLGVSRVHSALPWLKVDFRGGVDDSTLLWVLSGGVNSDEVVRDYQLAVPLYSSYSSTRIRSAAPLNVKPLIRIINNTSGSDNVFLTTNNNKKMPGKEEGGGGDRLHVVNLTKNVSCVLEYSTMDRYEAIINKMYRDGLVLVKGDAEVPRVFPTLDGKWMDNSRDNSTFTPLSVSRWKMPSASLVYGMLSKKTKEEEQNQECEEKKNKTKISAPSVIDFMGGRAGDVFLKMLTLPSEQPIAATTDSSSFDALSTNKGLWKTNKDGYTSIDAQSMMARLISDDKRPIDNARAAGAVSSLTSMAIIPYSDAAKVVINDPLEVYNSNNSWWIRGIQPSMRRNAATLSALQEHLYFVQTPIF